MSIPNPDKLVPLTLDETLWQRVFTVAPLVIIGSREEDGSDDFAPKHLAMPLSWENHFGFVCTPRHATYHNVKRQGVFTVSYPRPTQALVTSLSAGPRTDEGTKPSLRLLPTVPARQIAGAFIAESYLFLECQLERVIDGFAQNSLIAAKIVAAYAAEDCLRREDLDDNDLLVQAPLLAYLNWGRFASIDESYAFPFLTGFER